MDSRNFRPDKKDRKYSKSGVAGFLDRQGIYIIMLVCLALIGITAYFTLSPTGESVQLPSPTPVEQVNVNVTPTPNPTATPKPTPAPTTPAKTPKPTTAPSVKLLYPVKGEIMRGYSPDKPVYFATLNEWMVHRGVDIKAAEGADVKAALDGTIESTTNDSILGYTVTIKHSNNRTTLYGNLLSLDGITVGQTVKRGEAFAKVGRSSMITSSELPHLHFEYFENGKSKDPTKLLSND